MAAGRGAAICPYPPATVLLRTLRAELRDPDGVPVDLYATL